MKALNYPQRVKSGQGGGLGGGVKACILAIFSLLMTKYACKSYCDSEQIMGKYL